MEDLILNPEREALKLEAEALRKEFLRLYTEKDRLISEERDSLYIRYLNLLGNAKYENFCLHVELQSLKRKVEMAQAYINRNQRPDMKKIERDVAQQLEKYYDMVKQQAQALEEAKNAIALDGFDMAESRQLYRLIVKRLHPDLHPDQSEQDADLFIKGQTAYRTHNLDLLREIVMRLDMDRKVDDLLKHEESLEDIIARLKRQVEDLKNDIRTLNNQFPLNLADKLYDKEWVENEQRQLQAEKEDLEKDKEIYTQRLTLLMEWAQPQ